jgi:hypothetical protein
MPAATLPPAWAAPARDMSTDAHRQAGGGRTLGRDETFINAELASYLATR